MEKKGQFYIIAAILIILVISGITSIVTYSYVKSQPKSLEEVSSDLKEEAPRIIDYGIYNGVSVSSLMYNFTNEDFANYFLHKTDYTNATFIYGDRNKLYKVEYIKDDSGGVGLGEISGISIKHTKIKTNQISVSESDENISVRLLDRDFKFKLRDNEMFYFVITGEKNGEIFVEKN